MRDFSRRCRVAWALGALISAPLAAGRAQEQIEATVGTVGTVANDGPLPAGGVSLVGGADLAALKPAGRAAGQARVETIAVLGQPAFATAVRVRTPGKIADEAVLLTADSPVPLKSGDTLFIRLWGRAVETNDPKGESTVRVSVHNKNEPTNGAFFGGTARFGKEWRRFDLPIPARQAFKETQFSLLLGGKTPRVIELAGLEALNYGQRVLPHQLPYKRTTFEGRDPSAGWRAEAQARIEKHRKGDLTVFVVDANNKPVPGAQVKIAMTRHAYGFGTAVNRVLLAPSADGEKYRAAVKRLFNTVVVENDLKWGDDTQRDQTAMRLLAYSKENNLSVRGHCVIWPGWRNLPKSVKALYDETKARQGEAAAKTALRERLNRRIDEIVTRTKGYVTDWDVVNETVGNHDLMDILGRDVMVDWYKRVHAIVPNATLYHNENSVESGSKVAAFESDLLFLQSKGAPIGGAGLQGHVGPLPIATVQTNLDRIAKTGLTIKITEFDFVSPDEQLQADYTRDFLTLVFSHPRTQGFLMWGFWDGAQWLGDAPIFYRDWTLKPSGKAFEDLVLKTWWTNAAGATDKEGAYKTRGFLGDYNVTVTAGGKTKTIPTTLGSNKRSITLVLE